MPTCRLMVLVARERRKIISMQMEKQEKLVRAMKKEIKNEIQRGIAAYKVRVVDGWDGTRIDFDFFSLRDSWPERNGWT